MRRYLILFLCMLCLSVTARSQGTTNYPTSLDTTTTLPQAVDAKFTYLTVAINNSATTITVNSTGSVPASGVLQIDSELLAYTTASGTTFTVTRAFSGTTAAAHANLATVRFPLVSAYVNGVRGATLALEAKVGIGNCPASAASTGYMLTKLADGSTCWGAGPTAPIDNLASQSVLGSNFIITAASGTYEDTGLSISLPSAGTYILMGNIYAVGNFTSTGSLEFTIKLYNATDSADVANSERSAIYTEVPTSFAVRTVPLTAVVTVAGAKTIHLYVKRTVTGGTFGTTLINSSSTGRTTLAYLKVSN